LTTETNFCRRDLVRRLRASEILGTPDLDRVESIGAWRPSKGLDGKRAMTAKRILVPLEGSVPSEAAAMLAADVARSSGGSIRLLRVAPVPDQLVGQHGRVIAYLDQEMERLTAEGRDYLEAVEARLDTVPVESVVRFGDPVEEILTEAEAFNADLIVLTTGERGWLKRAAGRGVSDQVLRKAAVPVVLVRPVA
jgi:nucleotide-binding universal stress UspA family protein